MKQIKLSMTVVFALAIGAAFAGKEKSRFLPDSQQLDPTTHICSNVTTGCKTTGAFQCAATNIYRLPVGSEPNCPELATKRANP